MQESTFLGRASGRLDVMGGVADYSGSLVLQMPVSRETQVRLAPRDDTVFRVHSDAMEGGPVEIDLRAFVKPKGGLRLRKLRRVAGWAIHVIACAVVLHEFLDRPLGGAEVWIESDIPPGRGVSASAALEVAVLRAYGEALGIRWAGNDIARLGQAAENQIVGAPCGIMDQLVCSRGTRGCLLPILCQPDHVWTAVPVPEGMHFVGIDSGVTHRVAGRAYREARAAAFMGYSIIARHHGIRREQLEGAVPGDPRLPHAGYLANISVSVFDQELRDLLPRRIRGRRFLDEFGPSIDPCVGIDPKTRYSVRAATAHPIRERHRAELFLSLLLAGNLPLMGELMYQSHTSYGRCGLGAPETDAIVEAARAAGVAEGVHGARVSGGGCGGVVCLLVEGEAGLARAARIADGRTLFHG